MRDDFSYSEKRQFWYRPHPLTAQAYQLLHWDSRQGYQPVGDYIVLDKGEEMSLSERKVQNLVTLMNGHMRLHDLRRDMNGARLLFQLQDGEEGGRKKIVMRHFGGTGVSRENALLLIEKEYWSDATH
ncbi:MAG: hypothetical protein V4621_01720 [Pseudomonadota bacterium]